MSTRNDKIAGTAGEVRPRQLLPVGVIALVIGFAFCAALPGLCQETGGTPAAQELDRQFVDAAPYAADSEVLKHFGYSVPLPQYDIKTEKFRVVMPSGYSTNESWGLLVWISAEDQARVPPQLVSQLTAHRLLLVSAYKSGNGRHPLDRFRLALDAKCNMCRTYVIDRKRLYVSGFSGGSRIASMLGVAYGDLFSGTLCFCGVNFFRTVRGSPAEEYPATYDPAPSALARAKQSGRFALVTGETDPNRLSTKTLSQTGFKRENFKNVLYLEVPGMGHAVPEAAVISKALDFLEPAYASPEHH